MSRQIQIRRGTAAQHETFTGAVGELTFDGVTLRVHDGATPGGIILARADEISASSPIPDTADYVVETQLPTAANNYTWYRKYTSGWVEQGGKIVNPNGNLIAVTLPIPMKDIAYAYSDYFEAINNASGSPWRIIDSPGVLISKNTTTFSRYMPNSTNTIWWIISGLSAD